MDLNISSNAGTVKGVKKQNKESNREADLSNCKNVEIGKRKKIKSRNSTVPPTSIYQKDLDVWLENCLKDVAAPQLSMSSEFLEYNPSSFHSLKKSQQVVNPNSQELAQNLKNFLNYGNKIPKNSHLQYESSVEFASLPPLINFGTNRDNSTNHILPDGNESNKSFRFSDPCLIGDGPSDQESKISGKEILDPPNLDNKFLSTILEQINRLHETNSKICRNLHETKVEIEALKHAPNWGLRHRRDSLSGLSTHSQPMGLVFGTQSPAPTYNSGVYAPGMMTDLIREVKEAARIREEALLNRVKALVEERSWSVGEGNFKILRDVEEMKVQIQHLRNDKKEANKRIVQLETENKCIRSILASILNNHTPQPEVIKENAHLNSNRIRKNYGFNINYGTINQDEDDVCRMTSNDKNIVNKSSSSDGANVGSYIDQNSFINLDGNSTSYRIDTLYATPESEQIVDGGEQALQMEKDTLDLRRELQEALASKKHAENRIIALENMLKHLQIKDNHHPGECNTTSLNGFVTHSELRNSGRSSVQGLSSKLSLAGPITDL